MSNFTVYSYIVESYIFPLSTTDNDPLCNAEIHDILILQGYWLTPSGDTGMCTAGLLSIIFAHSCSARQTSGDIFIEWQSETVISQLVMEDVMRFRPAVCQSVIQLLQNPAHPSPQKINSTSSSHSLYLSALRQTCTHVKRVM